MTTAAEYVLHAAGPMQQGIQKCAACGVVLADERSLDLTPGSTRYGRGLRVLVLNGQDFYVRAPYPQDAALPPKTRLCTSTSDKD